MAKIPPLQEQDDGWTKWGNFGWKFRTICCGCGLAHEEEYKVEDGQLWGRFSVNNISTAAVRRRKKKK